MLQTVKIISDKPANLAFSLNKDLVEDCDKQWLKLNRHVYFRPSLAFYYLDLKQLKLYYERNTNFNYTFKLLGKLEIKANTIVYFPVKNFQLKEIHGHDRYRYESLTANLSLADVIDAEFSQVLTGLEINEMKLSVLIQTENSTQSTSNKSLSIKMKYFRQVDNNFKQKSMICTKLLYLKSNYLNTINWWLELNRMHGFNKLTIYNNSMPSQMDAMFEKNSDFVQVIQFQCIPNFMQNENSEKPYIKSFFEFENVYKTDPLYYHTHFEFFTLNDCYLQNMDQFEHVTVMDQDESIVPRRLSKFRKLNNSHVKASDLKNENECLKSSSNIISYLNR